MTRIAPEAVEAVEEMWDEADEALAHIADILDEGQLPQGLHRLGYREIEYDFDV